MQIEQLPHKEKLEKSGTFHFEDQKAEGDVIMFQNIKMLYGVKAKLFQPNPAILEIRGT